MAARRTRSFLALMAAAAALSAGMPARAASEAELKAAIVFNLLLFVEWPPESRPAPGSPWILCVSPSNASADVMRQLAGRPLRDSHLQLAPWPDGERSARCHAAFLGAEDLEPGPKDATPRKGLLTIADVTARGSDAVAIRLRSHGNRLGFSLNMQALKASQIQPSLKLVRLAQGAHE